jgi:hypothetical protein
MPTPELYPEALESCAIPFDAKELSRAIFKPRRNVRFHEARIVSILTPASSMSQDLRDAAWYPRNDLDAFKTEARLLSRKLRAEPSICNEASSHTRGLEHRVSLERQRNKIMTLRCILKAHQKFADPEHVAIAARKCTAWAREVALVEGSRDFCEAYYPDLTSLVPGVVSTSSDFPFGLKKRSGDASQQTYRCVRPRIQVDSNREVLCSS